MITGISGFVFFFRSKNGRFVTHMFFFKKKFAETPIFIVFWGCAFFGPSCQKREILDTHPKGNIFWLIIEKLILLVFFVFSCLFPLSFCFFFHCFLFCLGGFKGQVRWPWRATSLGPKPSLLVFFCSGFLGRGFVSLGGFKGQVRWPEGPPHLALNPPYLFFFVFFFVFLFFSFFVLIEKPVFPPKKGIFCLFLSVSLCFSLAFFGLPLFTFSFSVSLSLFFSFFLSFFLLSFGSLFCLFHYFWFFFAFVSWKEQHQILQLQSFFHQSFLIFVGFLSSFFFQIPFPYLCFFFLILTFVFCSTSMLFLKKNTNFWSRGGLQHNLFFY